METPEEAFARRKKEHAQKKKRAVKPKEKQAEPSKPPIVELDETDKTDRTSDPVKKSKKRPRGEGSSSRSEGFRLTFDEKTSAFSKPAEFMAIASGMVFPADQARFDSVDGDSMADFSATKIYQAFEAIIAMKKERRELVDKVASLDEQVVCLQKEVAEVRTEHDGSLNEIQSLREQRDFLVKDAEDWKAKYEKLRSEKDEADRKIDDLQKRVDSVKDDAIICTFGKLMKEFKEGKTHEWPVDTYIKNYKEYLEMQAEDEGVEDEGSLVEEVAMDDAPEGHPAE